MRKTGDAFIDGFSADYNAECRQRSKEMFSRWFRISADKRRRQRLKGIWHFMLARCLNPSHSSYRYYGAKGITVCERWLSFENFADDMLPGYKIGLTIDRIDSSKGYFPENCQWLSKSANSRKAYTDKCFAELDKLTISAD